MVGRLLCLVWLLGIVTAGPITWDDSKCSTETECVEGTKFLYADGTTYTYRYEAFNSLFTEGSSEISSTIKAVVEITKASNCEMVLKIKELHVEHGSSQERTSSYIEDLKRNPLPFSWDDGRIKNICPSPEDRADILNVKRGILSALQNSMKNIWHDMFLRETDVLGTCDTSYTVISGPPANPKTSVRKTKNLASCAPHLQGKTAFLSTAYDSLASPRQDLPLLTDREFTCDQVIDNGVVEETVCQEKGGFQALYNFGYGVKVKGQVKLQLISTASTQVSPYTIQSRKNLAFEYEPRNRHVEDSEAETVLRDLCPQVEGLLKEGVGDLVIKIVNIIRGLAPQSVERIYNSLKQRELCNSPKALGIYLDALKMASTEGAVQLLTKLTTNNEISETEVMFWFMSMPLAGRPDEGAIRAALPLLQRGVGSRQAYLSVSAMAHKFCLHHPDCESVQAIKDLISTLDQFLDNKCQSSTDEINDEIITALKSFGNLGHVGDSRNKILDCALNTNNGWTVRIAAVEAFRRTSCSEPGRERLLELFSTVTEETEERIAAFLTLIKCPSAELMRKIQEIYDSEISEQVKVFVWSYFENLKTSSDPSKRLQNDYADRYLNLEEPHSVDVTKFSRNFQRSLFSEILNIGGSLDSNLIFTRHSFLPRSLNLDYSIDFFGHKLNLLEMGVRVEDLEVLLETVFGPYGALSGYNLKDIIAQISGDNGAQSTSSSNTVTRRKRATNPYQQKLDTLDERVNFQPWRPQGSLYIRILGNELRWRRFDMKTDWNFGDMDIQNVLRQLAEKRTIDAAHSFMFLDTNILIPSATGRAYELAANGSVTAGLKAEGKFEIQQGNSPSPNADIDGKFQPSVASEVSAAVTLHSEDYEPGYKMKRSVIFAQDTEVKFRLVNGRKLYTKLNFPTEEYKLYRLTRDIYAIDENGERRIRTEPVTRRQYCTEQMDQILGLRVCGRMNVYRNASNSWQMGSLDEEITIRKTDSSVTGYEFIMEIPETEDTERIYKLSVDTPGSTKDRRYSSEIKVTEPDSETYRAEYKLHTPFYTLDSSSTFVLRPDFLQLRVEANGDNRRHYQFRLDLEKNIRGARLAEYKPSLFVSVPNRDPIAVQGTVVFAKGNKEQLSIDLSSDSFGSPLKIKGNFAKEGELDGPESNCRLATDVTMNFREGTYRLHGTVDKKARDYSLDIKLDCQPPDIDMHSIQLSGKLGKVNLYNPTSFSLETEVRLSEHPEYNHRLKWDFSSKLLEHLKNDVTLSYGSNLDDGNRIHFKQFNKFHGDFISFRKMNFENEFAFAVSSLQIDKSAILTVFWDFRDNPRFSLEVGAKAENSNELKAEINYLSLSRSPVKVTTEAKVIYFGSEYIYRDQLQEINPKELQGKVSIESLGRTVMTIDYIYKIKSDQRKFHHEIDGTINIPGRLLPIQQKALLKFSRSNIQLHSRTDLGSQSPVMIDIKLNKVGQSEMTLQLPFIEGKLQVNSQVSVQTIEANFQTKGRDDRKIVATGTLKEGVSSTLNLKIAFDADRDPGKLIVITGTSTEAESGDKHIINGNINYVGAVNIDISGTVGKTVLVGPHYFRADFSGNMEPTSLVLSYQIRDKNLECFLQHLRSDVEKLRADLKGKFIHRGYHLDIEGGLSVVSPFRTFNGKEIYYKLYMDSSGSSRTFETEYRLKYAPDVGYVGKAVYSRRRGWPGNVKTHVLFTVDGRPIYEAKTELEYSNKKYSFTTNLIPSPRKRFNLETSFEYAARYANFHHSMLTSLQHFQTLSINAVADLRESENFRIASDMNVNNDNWYDVNATLSSRSITDFEYHMLLSSKTTPSIHVITKTNNGNSYTEYTLNIKKDGTDVVTGKGELRKRKKSYTADATLKYRENDIMILNINNDAKSNREQNYAVKAVLGSSTYTANINYAKERRATTRNTINLCAADINKCIEISTVHKETETKNEWLISYKREDVELNFERSVARTDDNSRYHALVQSAGKMYGYDIQYGKDGENKRCSIRLMSTPRDVNVKVTHSLNPENLYFKINLQTDAKRFPDRELVLQVKSKNTFGRQSSTETEIDLTHPIFEKKKIEAKIRANLDVSSSTPLTAELSADYSTNPDHKLITKIRTETLSGDEEGGNLYVEVYHKDDQHLLVSFVTKGKLTSDDFSFTTGLKWPRQDGSEKQVNVKVDWIFSEHKMHALYNRPGMDQTLNAVAVYPPERKTIEVDIEYIVNGEVTNSKLAYYRTAHCTNIDFIASDSEFFHKTEVCFNKWSRNLFSIHMETNDPDSGLLHNSFEVIHQDYGMVKIRNQWNSDFIGILTYHLMAIFEEVATALESPPETSEKLNSMYLYLEQKIFQPAKDFLSRGYANFATDINNEIAFFREKITEYYEYLPSAQQVFPFLEPVGTAITDFVLETLDQISGVTAYYEAGLQSFKEIVSFLERYCSANPFCPALINAIVEGSYSGFTSAIDEFFRTLPEQIVKLTAHSEEIKEWMAQAFVRVKWFIGGLVKSLESLLHYPYIQDVSRQIESTYGYLREQYGDQIDSIISDIRQIRYEIQRAIADNEEVRRILNYLRNEMAKLRAELQEIDLRELYFKLLKLIEDFLSNARLPSAETFYKMNTYDPERGVFDIDLYTPVDISIYKRILIYLANLRHLKPKEVQYALTTRSVVANLKRIADFNFLPPYEAQAHIVGKQHLITFDSTLYDFAGECSYLLSRDFDDGNFTVILKYPERSSGAEMSLIMMVGEVTVEVKTGDNSVQVGERTVDLPFSSEKVLALHEENTIIVGDRHGVVLKCHTVHKQCSLVIPGWYFGKTAGLFGKYNYERFDDFMRPRGNIAQNIINFAKAWEVSKGCKPKNLAQEDVAAEGSESYRICDYHFRSTNSPLADCFRQVRPQEYFQLCLRHLPGETDKTKALCNVAAAYVSECEQNYLEITLPRKCLECSGPDGSVMRHGELKKFEGSPRKTVDLVFVIENHSCNRKLIRDLSNLARSFERELVNADFAGNKYSIISFGGSEDRPLTHTVNGKTSLDAQEVVLTTENFATESRLSSSWSALDALKYAVGLPFRSGSSKTFVLLTCTPCKYSFESLAYPVVQQLLLEHAINLHVINNQEIQLKKSTTRRKDIVGVDAETVYSIRDVTQKDLDGDPSLRSQITLPKDMCVALSQDVGGSFFSSSSLEEGTQTDLKNWRSILARRVLKTTKASECQLCDCTSTKDQVAKTVCQPCTIQRPKLPFTVCKDCDVPRYIEPIVSLMLHLFA